MQSNGLKDTSLKQKTKIVQPQSQKQFETIGECTLYNVNVYCTQGWEFAHSLIAHLLIHSFRSNQMRDC